MMLDIGGDDDGIDLVEGHHAVTFAPREELRDRLSICRARIFVADRRRKELDEAPGGGVAGAPDRRRQIFETGAGELARPDRQQFAALFWSFFAPLPLPTLLIHNVLYDTPCRGGVKGGLAWKEGGVKRSCPQAYNVKTLARQDC